MSVSIPSTSNPSSSGSSSSSSSSSSPFVSFPLPVPLVPVVSMNFGMPSSSSSSSSLSNPSASPSSTSSSNFPFSSSSQSQPSSSISLSVPSPSPTSSSSSSLSSSSLSSPSSSSSSSSMYQLEYQDLPPIKLLVGRDDRQRYDNLADLYSLLITMEHVETAYVRDTISNSDYTSVCSKLIAQYKTLKDTLPEAANIEKFCVTWGIQAKAAEKRFLAGVPATILHGDTGITQDQQGAKLTVFHVVQHFITSMDSLKLNLRAVDQLYPSITDLMDSINKVTNLPTNHDSRVKVQTWLIKLSSMRAHEELTEEQARQMSFDLDSAYNAFHKFVQSQ